MQGFVSDTIDDMQTAVTSLGGAVAGAASESLGDYVIQSAGLQTTNSMGDIGLRFVVRALVSSAVYAASVQAMPATSQNILFTLFYFRANGSLATEAATIGAIAVGGLRLQGLQKPEPPVRRAAVARSPCGK